MTHQPKALFFDIFGTIVDWRSGMAREAQRILEPLNYSFHWAEFADAWRDEYQAGMEEIRSGRMPFSTLDVVHRYNLARITKRYGLEALSENVLHQLVLGWHKLDAWPEVPEALARLRTKFLVAPVSNGNISLMVDLARRNNFHWDAILGAEVARDYKPKPEVYLTSARAFDLAPGDCMMVAAHSSDLAAASACGLRTAHIARPSERGPGRGETAPSVPVDLAATDLNALADQLGC